MSIAICDKGHEKIIYEASRPGMCACAPTPRECPICEQIQKVTKLEEELGKKEYEITQLEGTIADLHEQILAYHS